MDTKTIPASTSRGGFTAVAALGAAAVWLFLAGIIGAIAVSGDDGATEVAGQSVEVGERPGEGDTAEDNIIYDEETGQFIDKETGQVVDPATRKPVGAAGPATPGEEGPGGTAPGPETPGAPPPPPPSEGDRQGVTDTEIKYGLHAPLTLNNAPLNLAEDPIRGVHGYLKYINDNGGIHGRKIALDLQDDKYTATGGAQAGRALVEHGNFIISGTLGVDQIAQVANEAKKAGIPYLAAGGHEPQFADFGVHQLGTSYDTHVIELAKFLAKDPTYKGKAVGISYLNSPYIVPAKDVFVKALKDNGVPVASQASIEKPDQQSTYGGLIQKFINDGVEVFVPLQDPVSTARIVSECGPPRTRCPWTYSMSNFAHESDVALTLFGGAWGDLKVRGLSGGCYYLAPQAYDPAKCAAMHEAHRQWVAVYDEENWKKDGQGGASGYQVVYFWVKAMTDAGRDLTRERFLAALHAYNGYDNLVSSPITFAGKAHYAHGSEMMTVYEAQTNETWKMLSDGFTTSY